MKTPSLFSMKPKVNDLAVLRRKLENLHIGNHPKALELAWPHIDHSDRFVRWAALMAIQRLPIKDWADKALTENSFNRDRRRFISCKSWWHRSFPPKRYGSTNQSEIG